MGAALAVAVVCALGAAGSAQADTVLDSGIGWGGVGLTFDSNTVAAQPFTAPADPVLHEVVFPASLLAPGSITATISLYAWDGVQIVGPALAVSAPVTIDDSTAYHDETPVMPDVSLVSGQQYAIFIDTSPGSQVVLGQRSVTVSGFGRYRVKVGANPWQDSVSGTLLVMRLTFTSPAAPVPDAPPAIAPTVALALTDGGSADGGQQLTIRGANFSDGTQVLFGDTPAVVRVDRYDQLTVTVPAHAPGTVTVRIVTPAGTTEAGIYTYDAGGASVQPAPVATRAQPQGSDRCLVPDLRGLTVRGARQRLSAAGCRLGHVRRVVSRHGATTARIVRQSRAPTTMADAGAAVDVTLRRRAR